MKQNALDLLSIFLLLTLLFDWMFGQPGITHFLSILKNLYARLTCANMEAF